MSALGAKLRRVEGGRLMFMCPGCNEPHMIKVEGDGRPRWNWDGSTEHPTFSPSILVRTGRALDPGYNPEPDDPPEVCHSFVRSGKIQFLNDCTHDLAGQTVDLPDWPTAQGGAGS